MAKRGDPVLREREREFKRIDNGGDAWLDTDEVVALDVKMPLDKVIPVRLTSHHWDALHREAQELGVGPTTLARMWILEKMRSLPARQLPRRAATPKKPRSA